MKKIPNFTGDRVFSLIVGILVVAGVAMFLSASLGLLARQNADLGHVALTQLLFGLLPGVTVLILLRFSPPALLEKYIIPFYVFALICTVLVFVPGLSHHANGASRWIQVGSITIQPAEFLKIAVVLMFASYLTRMRSKLSDLRYGLLGFVVIVGIPSALLLLQPNTSTVMVMAVTTLVMYLLAGAPPRDFAIIGVVAIVGLGVLVSQRQYLVNRIMTFAHPEQNSQTTGYQIKQSLIAIGSGGLLGRGYGQSVQKFNYLPEPMGDSIFAVYSEEFGFVGAAFLILLFCAFAARGLMIAARAATAFGMYMVVGLTLLISVSAFLNIGAMLAVFPLTGLPLPFISHGGTALLAALASVGLILNVAGHRTKRKAP